MSGANEPKWYVAHTYSGYENKVKANIEATVQSRAMEAVIVEVVVPMQDVEEIKNGVKKVVQKKVFPGYVLVKMFMTDESWYVVRNTRGVTGFVGPASKPVALTQFELDNLGIKEKLPTIDIQVGESIEVIDGPFDGFCGTVETINIEKSKIRVSISMFGRDTPVELDFAQVKKS